MTNDPAEQSGKGERGAMSDQWVIRYRKQQADSWWWISSIGKRKGDIYATTKKELAIRMSKEEAENAVKALGPRKLIAECEAQP